MIKVNGKKIEFKTFPNGETLFEASQLQTPFAYQERNYVDFKYETDSDLMNLLFVKKFIDSSVRRNDAWKLNIAYMPYSRMDRSEGGSAFTLKYVADFINSLNFKEVTILEPHSDVTPALINNCTTIFPSVNILKQVKKEINFNMSEDYIYFPDMSAQKRYSSKIGDGHRELVGMKKRDFATGKITSLDVIGKIEKLEFKVVMIDDLCSKGFTFFMGAQQLRVLGASEIYLIVGHCENSIFDGELLKTDLISKIFTTNSILSLAHDKIVVFGD